MKIEKNGIRKERQKTAKLKLFQTFLMHLYLENTGNCKQPSTPPNTSLSRIQIVNIEMVNISI
jgi:hypothetical protein